MFRSADSPLTSPLKKSQFVPSEGDSANQANGEAIPPQQDAEPEGSTVENTDDTKPQAPTEELNQNCETEPKKPVAETTAENKTEDADAAVDQSSVDDTEGAAEVCADVTEHLQNDETQSLSSTKEHPEPVSPVEPAEQPVVNTAAEYEGEHADAAVDQSNVDDIEGAAEVCADVAEHLQKDETQPVSSTKEDPEPVSPVEPAEQPVVNTAAENEGEHADTTVDQSNVDGIEGATEVCADEAEHLQNDETQPVSSTKENPEPVSPVEPAEQPVVNTAAENKGEHADTTVDQSNVKHNEAKVSADAHVEDPVAETSGTEESKDTADVPASSAVALKPQEESPTVTEPANATNLEDAGEQSTVQPAQGSCESIPPEEVAEKIVEAVTEVVVESSPDKSNVINAMPGEEAALQDSVEVVPDLVAESVSESPTKPAADSAVTSVECEVVSAATAEPVLKTGAEEVVECEIQPVDNAVVEQSVESTPESTADAVVELNIEDALETVAASGAEATQDDLAHRAIELTDALDVEPPSAETAPEASQDPKQSQTEETKLNEQADQTSTSEMFQRGEEELRSTQTANEARDSIAVCSFCDKIIDGNVKLTFNEPFVTCHAECLKCGVCAKALGDMLTPMFCHNQVIHCGDCFKKTLKT
ncbi:fap1 adhesin [Pempheris klunzingeri]|uniref:fap1 adhesin n=1 Tax=Pempheris klunzingeri TaxID=3127111 RepID=UPI0039807E60